MVDCGNQPCTVEGFKPGVHFAVRTNNSCPAVQAKIDPRRTYAGWFDDAVTRVCLHKAGEFWMEGLFHALRTLPSPQPSRRVVAHLRVGQRLGFLQGDKL